MKRYINLNAIAILLDNGTGPMCVVGPPQRDQLTQSNNPGGIKFNPKQNSLDKCNCIPILPNTARLPERPSVRQDSKTFLLLFSHIPSQFFRIRWLYFPFTVAITMEHKPQSFQLAFIDSLHLPALS